VQLLNIELDVVEHAIGVTANGLVTLLAFPLAIGVGLAPLR
jgi:hypothetical protein